MPFTTSDYLIGFVGAAALIVLLIGLQILH